jgi:superfamily II DNA/RNA helicase
MAQVAREKALKKFRDGKLKVLVATDVAARGIDVEGVTHVVNYSCPEDEKTYVHRIGRTGRAGATGIAITFVDWADVTRWKVINKALDLPFEEPAETYSTSDHFLHDQGIPPGTKGRVVPEKPAEKRAERPAEERKPRERTRRSRSRTRTRGGEPVEQSGDTSDKPAGSAESEGGSKPRRNRRRTRSTKPATSAASE